MSRPRPIDGPTLVRALLTTPPQRHLLAGLLRPGAPPAPAGPVPADPVVRWRVGRGARGLLDMLSRRTPAELERLAYERVPDAFSPTQGTPDPARPFEDRPEAEAVARALLARGTALAQVQGVLAGLWNAMPFFTWRPPETWSAAQAAIGLVRLLELDRGPDAACELCEAVQVLWEVLGREDRLDGFAAFLQAVAEP